MKLALLKGNRFNPWHLTAFTRLRNTEAVAFRAESHLPPYEHQREDAPSLPVERIYFDTQAGPPWSRAWNALTARYTRREPRILPFHQRLRDFGIIQTWELFTDWSAEALEAHRRWDIPLSVMVWDNIPFNMERNPERRRMKEAVARHAQRFIVHTERSLRTLDFEGVDPGRIVKFDPGVDTSLFCPGPGNRAEFGIGEDAFVILFVGWLLPRKGLDFLLLALRELIRDTSLRQQPVRLMVIGSGLGKDRIEQLVRRLGIGHACTFAGARPYRQMPVAFRAADVFVLPSIATPEWQEQLGMSLIEALACGVPIVSTHSGAIPEIVEDAAVLCQPNDFVSLYEALKDLIQEPAKREELGARGREHARRRFRLNRYIKNLAAVCADMLRDA